MQPPEEWKMINDEIEKAILRLVSEKGEIGAKELYSLPYSRKDIDTTIRYMEGEWLVDIRAGKVVPHIANPNLWQCLKQLFVRPNLNVI